MGEKDRRKPEQYELQSLYDIVNNSPDIIVRFNKELKHVYCNKSFELKTGIPAGLFIGKSFLELEVPKEYEKRFKEMHQTLKKCLETGEQQREEQVFLLPSGKKYFSTLIVPERDKSGNIESLLAITRDDTRQKQAEELLKKSDLRFQKMLSLVPDMISIHDPDMNILYSNWKGVADVPAEKRVLNTKCYNTYRGYDEICPDCQAVKVFQTKESFQKEVELPDGMFVNLAVIPVLDDDGNVDFFVEWVRDITAQKRAEEKRTKQHELAISLSKTSKMDEALGLCLSTALDITELDSGGIYLLDDESGSLYLEVHHGLSPGFIEKTACLTKDTPQLRLVMAGKPLYSGYSELGIKIDPVRKQEKLRAAAIVPITVDGNVIACFNMASHTTNQVSDNDKESLEALAALVGSFIARIKAEENLQKSESRYRLIAENTADVIIVSDMNLKRTYVSPSIEKQLGYTVEESMAMRAYDMLTPESLEKAIGYFREIFEREQKEGVQTDFLTLELQVICKDGSVKWVEDTYSIPRDENNEPQNIICVRRDINERKLTENLIASRMDLFNYSLNNTLHSTLQKTLDIVCDLLKSPVGFYHFVSPDEKMLTLMAWSTDTLKYFCEMGDKSGMHYSVDKAGVWTDCVRERRPVIHNDYPSLAHRRGLPEGHAEVTRELVVPIMRGGKIVAILGIGNKADDYTEKDIAIVTHFADVAWEIAERKQSEELLRESEEKYRRLFETMGQGAIYQAYDGSIISANPAAEKILGITVEEMKSKTSMDPRWQMIEEDGTIVPGTDHPTMIALRTGRHVGPVLRGVFIPEKNSYVWLIITAVPIFQPGSAEPFQAYATFEDVTRIKMTEDKLKEAHRQLHEEVNKAEKIHQRVLPTELPQTEKISMAAYNQPATQMGGDSYNVIRSENKLVIYVADVTGHGLDSAMISLFIKEAIDSYIVMKPEQISPQKILQHLNNQYRRQNFPDIQLIAIFLSVLDIETNEFKYASAGFQTRPLVRLGDGSKEILDTNGMFISNSVPLEIMEFKEHTLNLTPGTTMLISTDGLAEQDNGAEMFHEKYEETFYRNSHLPPEIIVQAINKDFCSFNSNNLVGIDDITYLVLQYGRVPRKKHSLKIKSDFAELESLYEKITELTAAFPQKNNLITCLHEIVVNAIKHGNRHHPEKIVSIDLTVTPEYVLIEVEVEGEGFDWCEKLDKPVDMSISGEGGRGIALTGLMSGNLYYNRKGNKATMLVQAS